jgi:hypothetical protein
VNNDTPNLDDLLMNYGKTPGTETTEIKPIPEPGHEDNPFVGIERVVHGQKQFLAFSGAQRRTLRRRQERDAKNEQDHGRIAYWKGLQKAEFKAGTRRQQLRILRGEISVSPAMKENLERAIIAEQKAHEAAGRAEEVADRKEQRRIDRHATRQLRRIEAGKARHADLVAYGHRAA